jgi:site-specific DNA-methyltransferase (adenine-specific)
MNHLYFGDNLDVMRRYIKDESVDLIYLDPPFNSNADYNVLFAEQDGKRAASQIKAFHDTWHWDQSAARAYDDFVETAPHQASQALQAFRTLVGTSDMLAYLSMMATRIVELHRVLKPTGSLYLHCDPTASHYLKILLDAVFGKSYFRSEIIWRRTSSHGNVSIGYGDVTDTILLYTKTEQSTWNQIYVPYSEWMLNNRYNYQDPDGRRFSARDLRNPGYRPNLIYEYKGYKPHPNGWSITKEKMEELDRQGRLYFPDKKDGRIRLKKYLDESPGERIQNLWDDIPPINSRAQERLGYPTQKPEALLERIIGASSNEGDVVFDPFCGCGTAISVAQRLNRRWIGIDITHLAVGLIKTRLKDAYGANVAKTYKVIGEPTALPDAEALAKQDRYQFQYWALGLVGARPVQADQKKGADKGIDGRLFFHDDAESEKTKQVIFSVKSGHMKNEFVREMPHVVDREKAHIGVVITLEPPTQQMRAEAASAGFYTSPWDNKRYPKVQVITVEELLGGKSVDLPPSQDNRTFKMAPKAKGSKQFKEQFMFETEEDD